MRPERATMQGRVCLVTGATSGIGRATAAGLARSGTTVLMVARDRERGERTAAELRAMAPDTAVELFVADLSSQQDVHDLAERVLARHERLDVLVNNAGAVRNAWHFTVDSVESTLAVNHLAPFLLTRLLEPALAAALAARVITVSSYLHHRVKQIPWDDLEQRNDYSAAGAYNLSKLFNVLFTYELARRWEGSARTANTLHPGWPLKTDLGREQRGAAALFDRASKLIAAPPDKGARTTLYLASSSDVDAVSGTYFARCRPAKSSALSHDAAAGQRLWAISEQLCGLTATR